LSSDEKCQKYPEALAAYTTSLQIREKTYGKNSPEYANVLNDVAWGYYYQQGDYDQAEKLLKEALMTYESSGNNIGLEIMTLTNLGEVYQAQHKDDLAESMYRKTYEHVNNWYYEDRSKENIATMALQSYATFLRNQGRDEEANSIEARVSTFQQ
jgi:tetratricopeptide (TPR) repeat protein